MEFLRGQLVTLVIEAQFVLVKSLRHIVEGHLMNVKIESMSAKWNDLVEHGFRMPKESEMSTLFINQGFIAPPVSYCAQLLDIVTARFASAQNQIWLLLTHPNFMCHEVRLYSTSQVLDGVYELREEACISRFSRARNCHIKFSRKWNNGAAYSTKVRTSNLCMNVSTTAFVRSWHY
jgi:hypothetical protein